MSRVLAGIRGHARAVRRQRRGQGGFLLLLVIGFLLTVFVVGIALLAATDSAQKVTTGMSNTAANVRNVDSALEAAVGTLRTSPKYTNPERPDSERECASASGSKWSSTGQPQTVGSRTLPPITVVCESSTYHPSKQVRDVQLNAYIGGPGGTLVGEASLRFTDTLHDRSVPGYQTEVCDWLIGKELGETLKSCP